MSVSHFCDVCGLILKEGEKTYLILIPEAEFSQYLYGKGNPENSKEICPTCKGILDMFLNLRKSGVDAIMKQIKDSFKTKIKRRIKKK
ncbi:hypothetical protein LCGC14_0305590 [marine sediment metagenome]|uniref:Uncharacterized protein n=1 Tax=marine sediment metagenome TaxID=412755 RepID=A0A0F9TNP6_9ZZZZ